MIKKALSILVILSMVFFIQCADESTDLAQKPSSNIAGSDNGGVNGGVNGGGSHTETTGNNLSFPAFLVDNYSVADITEYYFSLVYDGDYDGLTEEQIAYLEDNGPWYPQKTDGNLWQADYVTLENVDISWVDWGDAIEAVNPKIGRPYRLELVLYAAATPRMDGFIMAELEYPSSQNELQGTNTNTYKSAWASVASSVGKIVVQRIEGVDPATLAWDGSKWEGAGNPESVTFSVENNVGGKLIYGASRKGWKPNQLGDYRITFYVASGSVNISTALIGNYLFEGGTQKFDEVIEAETNTPVIDILNNLTYVDVTVTSGGGGGKS